MKRRALLLAVLGCAAVAAFLAPARISLAAQGPLAFRESPDHPAIKYSTALPNDAVAILNRNAGGGEESIALAVVPEQARARDHASIAWQVGPVIAVDVGLPLKMSAAKQGQSPGR